MDDTARDLLCIIGDEDINWWQLETDPDWWELYLWTKQN